MFFICYDNAVWPAQLVTPFVCKLNTQLYFFWHCAWFSLRPGKLSSSYVTLAAAAMLIWRRRLFAPGFYWLPCFYDICTMTTTVQLINFTLKTWTWFSVYVKFWRYVLSCRFVFLWRGRLTPSVGKETEQRYMGTSALLLLHPYLHNFFKCPLITELHCDMIWLRCL